MALMQKLRSSTKYIIWLLILSFGLLWVLADTQVFDAMMAGPRNMGEVNSETISYADFNQRVNMLTEQHRSQSGSSPNSEIRAQYEDMAWEQLVVDKILQQKMRDIGIIVTDSELIDMVTGDDPDPFIRQQFTREDSTIDRIALQNAIEAPENRDIWIMIEQQLREQRRQQKLNQFLEASIRVSDFEIRQHYKKENSFADIRYVRFPYSEIGANEVTIDDSDVQAYYDQYKDRFQRNKSWRFSYVTMSIAPTAEDSARTISRLAELKEDFRQTEDVELFLRNNFSESDYAEAFLSPSEIRREHLTAFELESGEVSEPYIHSNRAHMIRVLEDRPSEQTYVRVRQIQLPDDSEGEENAEYIAEQARMGVSFERLAKSYTEVDEYMDNIFDLGFIERSDKPEELSNAIFSASVGSIAGPIKSRGFIYVFQILDRANRDLHIADLSQDIEADPFETVQRLANEAEDFKYFAEEDGFDVEVERSGYSVQEGIVTDGNPFISGLGQSRMILNEIATMEEGDISDIIETEENFIVLRVNEVIPEGTRPLSEVRPQVESLVREQKRKEYLASKINDLLNENATLESLAEENGKTVQASEEIGLNAMVIPGAGREPIMVGVAFSLPEGKISPALAGNNAVYVMMVDSRNIADPTDISSVEQERIRAELQQQKTAALDNIWADRLKAEASIRDFRTQQRIVQ